jgi:hypothetical protein
MRNSELDSKFLRDQVCSLFTDEQRRGVGVGSKVIWADAQIADLEVLGTENVQAGINNTAFFLGLHS